MTAVAPAATAPLDLGVASPSRAQRIRWFVADSLVLARRNLEHVRQIPEKLVDVTIQPIMFVLLFAYVFGGVIAVKGGNYREYLIAGVLVQSMAFGLMGPAMSIATDLKEGVVDRFRSLPMVRAAYLTGHFVAEFAALALGVLVLSVTGLCVGWRVHGGVEAALQGYALLLLLGAAMIWAGTLLGIVVRSTDAVQGIGFVFVFPLTFLATTFVPLEGFSSVLRPVAAWNPVSAFGGASRELFGNPTGIGANPPWPMEHAVLTSVAWSLGILLVCVPLAVRAFAKRTAD